MNCASHSRAVVHLRENDPAGEAVKEKKSELSFSEFECARVTLDEESGKLNEDFKLVSAIFSPFFFASACCILLLFVYFIFLSL